MSFTRAELEQKIEWRELLGRTKEALTRALGREEGRMSGMILDWFDTAPRPNMVSRGRRTSDFSV